MQSVKVRRSGISAQEAAEGLRGALGAGYEVEPDGGGQVRVRRGMARATVSLRGEPGGTVFEVRGDGVGLLPLISLTTKALNDRGIARRTASAIGAVEAFRDDD
jgi:hypothetical protein